VTTKPPRVPQRFRVSSRLLVRDARRRSDGRRARRTVITNEDRNADLHCASFGGCGRYRRSRSRRHPVSSQRHVCGASTTRCSARSATPLTTAPLVGTLRRLEGCACSVLPGPRRQQELSSGPQSTFDCLTSPVGVRAAEDLCVVGRVGRQGRQPAVGGRRSAVGGRRGGERKRHGCLASLPPTPTTTCNRQNVVPSNDDLIIRPPGDSRRSRRSTGTSEPSLFASAFAFAGRGCLASLLTGRGTGGSEGVSAVRAAGGIVIAEGDEPALRLLLGAT
jgi:CheB methylesterase